MNDSRETDRRLRALEGSTTDGGVSIAQNADDIAAFPLVQGKRESVTTDAVGEATITFPSAFSSAPTVVVTIDLGTVLETGAWIQTITTTTFKVRLWRNGALDASQTRIVCWMAMDQT